MVVEKVWVLQVMPGKRTALSPDSIEEVRDSVTIVIFLIHFASGNFVVTRDGLDFGRGAARHQVSPNHPEFRQNYNSQNE